MLQRGLILCACAFAAAALSACESTQDKAAKLSESSTEAFTKKGLVVKDENPAVKVQRTWVLQDANGTAVGVRLKNTSQRRMVEVPIAVDVIDTAGKSIYKNDAPGLDRSLVGIAMLRPGESVTWVNDQVVAASKPEEARVVIGKEKQDLKTQEPRITLQQINLSEDPAGVAATGFVMNKSDVEQKEIVVYAVATKGGKVVALGKGQVPRVKPGKRAKFSVFFIGNPKGAKLDLAVPATVTR